ncbi:MAG: hypothetical protein WAN35_05090 [Terracidiphilus sp.]
MNSSALEILEDAPQLPIDEVNWLIESLLLDEGDEANETVEAAWDGEIDSGAVELIPGEQIHAEMIAGLSPLARARLRA